MERVLEEGVVDFSGEEGVEEVADSGVRVVVMDPGEEDVLHVVAVGEEWSAVVEWGPLFFFIGLEEVGVVFSRFQGGLGLEAGGVEGEGFP